MTSDSSTTEFQAEWFELAKDVVARIAADPAVAEMRAYFREHGSLTLDQRSEFVAVANRVKSAVMHEAYGPEGSTGFEEFTRRWRHWYDTKGVSSTDQGDRRLSNEEHIVYSSTPDAEEFFANLRD
ncbi:MAG: hypothetical protein KBD66_03955 [Candidatus Doudnabacteria bacterium]|nr:hypothetical protein [Candidatus Doudnabacteria bacterium]